MSCSVGWVRARPIGVRVPRPHPATAGRAALPRGSTVARRILAEGTRPPRSHRPTHAPQPTNASCRTASPGSTTRSRATSCKSIVSIERSRRSHLTSSTEPRGNTTTKTTSTSSPSSSDTSTAPNTWNTPSRKQTSAASIGASTQASDSNSYATFKRGGEPAICPHDLRSDTGRFSSSEPRGDRRHFRMVRTAAWPRQSAPDWQTARGGGLAGDAVCDDGRRRSYRIPGRR